MNAVNAQRSSASGQRQVPHLARGDEGYWQVADGNCSAGRLLSDVLLPSRPHALPGACRRRPRLAGRAFGLQSLRSHLAESPAQPQCLIERLFAMNEREPIPHGRNDAERPKLPLEREVDGVPVVRHTYPIRQVERGRRKTDLRVDDDRCRLSLEWVRRHKLVPVVCVFNFEDAEVQL